MYRCWVSRSDMKAFMTVSSLSLAKRTHGAAPCLRASVLPDRLERGRFERLPPRPCPHDGSRTGFQFLTARAPVHLPPEHHQMRMLGRHGVILSDHHRRVNT